ncbi:MAG: hypothetical protein CR986_04970 [Ignavibacteriae bacterium]|nr:MAG: hypothetical protein CR986_04970 [Ignavibacteriota bacterium]
MKKLLIISILIFLAACSTLTKKEENIKTGYFTYFADAALFVDSENNQKYSVAMEGDYINLEKEYLKNFAGGEKAFITVKAKIEKRNKMEGEGKIDFLIIEKLLNISKEKK